MNLPTEAPNQIQTNRESTKRGTKPNPDRENKLAERSTQPDPNRDETQQRDNESTERTQQRDNELTAKFQQNENASGNPNKFATEKENQSL